MTPMFCCPSCGKDHSPSVGCAEFEQMLARLADTQPTLTPKGAFLLHRADILIAAGMETQAAIDAAEHDANLKFP